MQRTVLMINIYLILTKFRDFRDFKKFAKLNTRRPKDARKFNTIFYFFPSLRASGILQILQSDWFRERVVFYDLARLPGRNCWQLHSQVCLLFVNEQNRHFQTIFLFKTCAISISWGKVNFIIHSKYVKGESSKSSIAFCSANSYDLSCS